MPSALDATVSGSSSNTYVTQAEATTLLDDQLYVAVWTAATSDNKNRALLQATFYLDRMVDWKGSKYLTTQALRWPRSGVLNLDNEEYPYTSIPTMVKKATAFLAVFLLTRDRYAEPAALGLGVNSASIGGMSASIDPKMTLEYLPDIVIALISDLGSPYSSAQRHGAKVVSLLRA